MPEPLTLPQPFPSTEGIVPDALSLRIISPSYASPESELNTILQYVYHSFFFERKGRRDISEKLLSIAVAEMLHLNLLGKTILALGASPIYTQFPPACFNFYSAKYVAYSSSLLNMLEDDILGERRAINGYERILKRLKNEQVKCIIARISEDEKLHLKTLQDILADFKH